MSIEDQAYFYQITKLINEEDIEQFEKTTDIVEVIKTLLEKNINPNGFYVVDISKIIDQYTKWVTHLPRVKPYYAVKCNPLPMILKILKIVGCGFDCASINEIMEIRNISDEGETVPIIYANPAKSHGDLTFARSFDIDRLTFDCEEDLLGIKQFHDKAELIIRIKVDDSGSVCKFNSKFGAKMNKLPRIFTIAKMFELNIIGVSFHVGSGCNDLMAYSKAIEKCKEVFDIALQYDYKLSVLDIGGGFPGTDSSKLKFEDIAKEINISLDKYFPENIEIIAEPGRYFAACSHTLVLSIIKKKKDIDDETGEEIFEYTLTDGVYGSFNCTMFDHAKPVIEPFNERDGVTYKSTVFGPTCDSIDTISVNCQLPDLLPGELVYIENFGAYTLASASTFNGFSKIPCRYISRK